MHTGIGSKSGPMHSAPEAELVQPVLMPKGGGAMIWKAHHAKVQVLRISSPPIGERRNFFSRFGMRASLMVAPHGCRPAYHGTMEITMMGSLMII